MLPLCGRFVEYWDDGSGDDHLWAITSVVGRLTGNETEAEKKAALERWTSLPEEEQLRLMMKYSEKRMRLARLNELP